MTGMLHSVYLRTPIAILSRICEKRLLMVKCIRARRNNALKKLQTKLCTRSTQEQKKNSKRMSVLEVSQKENGGVSFRGGCQKSARHLSFLSWHLHPAPSWKLDAWDPSSKCIAKARKTQSSRALEIATVGHGICGCRGICGLFFMMM